MCAIDESLGVADDNPRNSARRSAVLMNISRSWTALANQLESLTIIVKSEGM